MRGREELFGWSKVFWPKQWGEGRESGHNEDGETTERAVLGLWCSCVEG